MRRPQGGAAGGGGGSRARRRARRFPAAEGPAGGGGGGAGGAGVGAGDPIARAARAARAARRAAPDPALVKAALERFGPDHRVRAARPADSSFYVRTSMVDGVMTTEVNMRETVVMEAAARHARGVIWQEHALLHDDVMFRASALRPSDPRSAGYVFPAGEARREITRHAASLAYYMSAMAFNDHAADFVRYEHEKYSHLQRNAGGAVLRPAPLLSRAYVEAAAAAHSVAGLDAGEVTDSMSLDAADWAILSAARKMYAKAHRQRLLGRVVDLRARTASLDRALRGQAKPFAAD